MARRPLQINVAVLQRNRPWVFAGLHEVLGEEWESTDHWLEPATFGL